MNFTGTTWNISEALENKLYKVNPHILTWIGIVETWLEAPVNSFEIGQWLEKAEEIAGTGFQFLPEEWLVINRILDRLEKEWLEHFTKDSKTVEVATKVSQAHIQALVERTQTQQRTAEWFEEHRNLLTASEISDIFDSEAALASLVRSKILPRENRTQSAAVPSEYMTAFDWGIRFEPVVKQIYEHLYGVTITDLGRLYHPTQKGVAASPDGIISAAKAEKGYEHFVGNLIEIKCPVSRKPDGKIMPKYYHQMQLQMEVAGIGACHFAEFMFLSKYKSGGGGGGGGGGDSWEGGPQEVAWLEAVRGGALHGNIFLVERLEKRGEGGEGSGSEDEGTSNQRISHRYEYGPVCNLSWRPELDEKVDHIVETIPWALAGKTQQVVARDPGWWAAALPKIEAFWAAVEKGRRDFAEGRLAPPTPRRRGGAAAAAKGQEQICVIKLGS